MSAVLRRILVQPTDSTEEIGFPREEEGRFCHHSLVAGLVASQPRTQSQRLIALFVDVGKQKGLILAY